ncbi:MAG: hypothetical protein J7J22_04630 [Candidatus Verstraetearchaeota archaeon]|nr:hypothetical protein [Candidatus Verstraetearchaeota archaeon]
MNKAVAVAIYLAVLAILITLTVFAWYTTPKFGIVATDVKVVSVEGAEVANYTVHDGLVVIETANGDIYAVELKNYYHPIGLFDFLVCATILWGVFGLIALLLIVDA